MVFSEASAVLISNVWPGGNTGGAIAARSVLRQYSRHFHHISFIGLVDTPVNPEETHYPNVSFHHIPIVRRPLWLRFLMSLLSQDPAITVSLKEGRVARRLNEIVKDSLAKSDGKMLGIFENGAPTVYLPDLKRRYPKLKWLCRGHDVLSQAFAPFAVEGSIVSRLAWQYELNRIRRLEQRTADLSDFYWCITSNDATESLRFFGRKADGVVSLDIDPSRFDAVSSGSFHTIVYLGSADYRKAHGLRKFVEVNWPILRQKYPHARLLLGGIGTESLNRPEQGIEGLGFVQDPIAFLSKGFIFLNPQQAGSGIKVKSLNAMAAGKLLISSENGVLGIGGRNDEHYIVGETIDALGEAILAIWRDEDRARRIAANGSDFVRTNFNDKAMRASFDKLIKPVLEDL